MGFVKKNIFSIILIFVLLLFASCSATNNQNNSIEVPEKDTQISETKYSVTFIVSDFPEIPGKYIYLMGDFNNWIPGDAEYRLKKNNFGEWEITFDMPKGKTIEYKFNAGSYDNIEKDFFGDEVSPRSYKFNYDRDVVYHEIENW
ncbi:hypothetical protein E4650_03355 [Geotoga petraea]|uniref:CBM20 domain-containing protein n=1 Tax=Geotoga petraea TaxID=28234 RepID=A0A4Z0W3W2_9BACT|nr:hypothetical protein E4650_03355 [Geotoga petraea]